MRSEPLSVSTIEIFRQLTSPIDLACCFACVLTIGCYNPCVGEGRYTNMRFDRIGPLGLWNRFDEQWIGTRRAALLFLIASFFVLSLVPVFFGWVQPSKSSPSNFIWGVVGVLGSISIFFLWIGMWKYWARLDRSGRWAKRLWFIVMLVGFWDGSCLYCWCIYLPQVIRSGRQGVAPSSIEPSRHQRAIFGKSLLVAWVCFFLFVAILFVLPGKLAFAIPILRICLIVLGLTSFTHAIRWLYRQGVRRN